jgi:hypothetical protein
MLVFSSSERWRVVRACFSSFVCKSTFSGVSLTILLSQLMYIISLIFVIILMKQLSSEDFGSKS